MIMKNILFYSFVYSSSILNNKIINNKIVGVDHTKNDTNHNYNFNENLLKYNVLKVLQKENVSNYHKINLFNNYFGSSIKVNNITAGGLYNDWN